MTSLGPAGGAPAACEPYDTGPGEKTSPPAEQPAPSKPRLEAVIRRPLRRSPKSDTTSMIDKIPKRICRRRSPRCNFVSPVAYIPSVITRMTGNQMSFLVKPRAIGAMAIIKKHQTIAPEVQPEQPADLNVTYLGGAWMMAIERPKFLNFLARLITTDTMATSPKSLGVNNRAKTMSSQSALPPPHPER
jgi:hypothetical protein